jgi:hypothetical protein
VVGSTGRMGGQPLGPVLGFQGFLKFWSPRGMWEVHRASPNLWFAAAGSLRFKVTTVRCAYTPFVDLIGPFCGYTQVLLATLHRSNLLPDVVFSDLGLLPWGPGSDKYWQSWLTTHVFSCGRADNDLSTPESAPIPECPPGWSSQTVSLGHCEAGGATSGRWTIVAWYLPSTPFSEPLPVIPQSWFPLFCYVKDRERADPHPSPPVGGTTVPLVVRIEGLVQDWGLFPALDLVAKVLVQCSSSPSGHGSRYLTWQELGGLWDLPISIMDTLPTVGGDTLLWAFCKGAPTKILASGADFLLTLSFWGGLRGVHGAKRPLAVSDLGPRPWTDSELGLAKTLPTAHDDDAVMLEVRKGDSQKANKASVPDHLWLHAFAMGYGDSSCMA